MKIVKNGHTYYHKSRGKCKDCGRQFVFDRQNHCLTQEHKTRIELLLLERISLGGISRALEISLYHVYRYMEELYREVPQDLNANAAAAPELEICCYECESDELWSFVGFKENKQCCGWRWIETAGR